ncbi:MAG: glycerate kinase, partial [Acidimicrobiia bacterium]|nr:glycerate kinase [Acidimicrobiia bacterium]NNL29125.1 glycerate kinase [Acidimicrobiia bacterium]
VVSTALTGEARDVARQIISAAPANPGMAIYAGETTVTVTGTGRGGRNQELALAAGIALGGIDDVVVASVGTDGRDGLTDAAGAFGDGGTVARAAAVGLDAAACLADNDSNRLLEATGDLVITGPTGTNVGDLVVVYRSQPA